MGKSDIIVEKGRRPPKVKPKKPYAERVKANAAAKRKSRRRKH
jgi:hypothetical protein